MFLLRYLVTLYTYLGAVHGFMIPQNIETTSALSIQQTTTVDNDEGIEYITLDTEKRVLPQTFGYFRTRSITEAMTSVHNGPPAAEPRIPQTIVMTEAYSELRKPAGQLPQTIRMETTTQQPTKGTAYEFPLVIPQFSDNSTGEANRGVQGSGGESTPKMTHMSDLLGTILRDYDPSLRPVQEQSQTITVKSDFIPINLIDFDTQEQRFSVMGYFRMEWKDEFLAWTPAEHVGTRNIRIPAKYTWIPKLTYSKARYGNGLVGHRTSDIVLVHYSGIVRWVPEGIYDIVCGVDITFYPFDVQTCTLSYYISDEDNSTIDLQISAEVDSTEYMENAEWELVNLTSERHLTDDVYVVKYKFTVKRRAGFTLFTMMVPLAMLSVLSGTTFLIPIESGEKCCFSITVFLAFGIFETIVVETLPQNSLNVSYVIIYITFLLACSTFLVFYAIVQARINTIMGNRILSGRSLTFANVMRKVDNFVFLLFIIVEVGVTILFLIIMSKRKTPLTLFKTIPIF